MARKKVTEDKMPVQLSLLGMLRDPSRYEEERHCNMVILVLGNHYQGTIADFCKSAVITEREFNEWRRDYPLFNKSVEYGMVLAKINWQNEPERFKAEKEELEFFDLNKWKFIGKYRFGIGDQPKIHIHIDKTLSPIEQYGQLLDCAAMGYFSASEFKQVSEAINIGIRAHEIFEMQKELDEIKETLKDINERQASNGFNIPTDSLTQEDDNYSIPSEVCEAQG